MTYRGCMPVERREAVLESALETFARHGYRRTSMEAVATAARISRPGLYFLFDSKAVLFREAAAHVLGRDLAAIEEILGDAHAPLADRLLEAFDRWAGRYVGPLAQDVPGVLAENPGLLDDTATNAPAAFERLVTDAVSPHVVTPGAAVRTLLSVSVGLKHQAADRSEYRERFREALEVVLPSTE